MRQETLTALRGSIRKWKLISMDKEKDLAQLNCPLCRLFLNKGCSGCPVYANTNMGNCDGTPYRTQWLPIGGHGRGANTPALKSAALSELDFLKSLLPKRKHRTV